jgi:hypothetical protein
MEVQELTGDARYILVDIDIPARIEFLIHGIAPSEWFSVGLGIL